MEAELERVKQTLAQVCQDSKEIEQELEKELNESNARCRELEDKLEALSREREPAPSSTASTDELKSRLQEMETKNDELEHQLRVMDSDLQAARLEAQELLEKLALKEAEAISGHEQAEIAERLRQELLDSQEENQNLHRLVAEHRRAAPFGMRSSSKSRIPPISQKTELRSKHWHTENLRQWREKHHGA